MNFATNDQTFPLWKTGYFTKEEYKKGAGQVKAQFS